MNNRLTEAVGSEWTMQPLLLPERAQAAPSKYAAWRTSEALAAGVSRRVVYSERVMRAWRGILVARRPCSDLEAGHVVQEIIRPDVALAERSALEVHGLPHRISTGIEVIVPTQETRIHRPGIICRVRNHAEVEDINGVRVTTVRQTIADTSAHVTELEVVQMVDAALNLRGPGFLVECQDFLPTLRGRRGKIQFERALERARPRVESPKETELRLLLVDHGFPEPSINLVVLLRGRSAFRLDLAYKGPKIGIEYQGDHHRSEVGRWRKDVSRNETLTALGWRMFYVTQADLHDPAPFLARLREALRDRSTSPSESFSLPSV